MRQRPIFSTLLCAALIFTILLTGCEALLRSEEARDEDDPNPELESSVMRTHLYSDRGAVHLTWETEGGVAWDHVEITWSPGGPAEPAIVEYPTARYSIEGLSTSAVDQQYDITFTWYEENGAKHVINNAAFTEARMVRYVDGASAGGDGCTWEQAYNNLGDALSEAAAGGYNIYVAEGSYKPHTGDRSATFLVPGDTRLYGGFEVDIEGPHPPPLSAQNFVGNETILSGDLNGDDEGGGDNSENSLHVVTLTAGSTIDGFTITGGHATGPFNDSGADMYEQWKDFAGGGLITTTVEQSQRTRIVNCTFEKNEAAFGGGAWIVDPGTAVEACTFTENEAKAQPNPGAPPTGGALMFSGGWSAQADSTTGGYAYIGNSSFSDNKAYALADGDGGHGGAMQIAGSMRITVADSTFTDNWGEGGGGAIERSSSQTADVAGNRANAEELFIQGCTFYRNSTNGSGGAITADGPEVNIILRDTEFKANQAVGSGVGPDTNNGSDDTGAGGAAINVSSNGNGIAVDAERCTFVNNTASGTADWVEGGAISMGGTAGYDPSSFAAENCLFVANSASNDYTTNPARGGAIAAWENCDIDIGFSTFYGNSCDDLDDSSTGSVKDNHGGLGGGAISSNHDGNETDNECRVTVNSSILWGNGPYEVSYGGTNGDTFALLYSDIQGGYTGAGAGEGVINSDPLFVSNEDQHLQSGSPCIDAASTADVPEEDLEGNARPATAPDMGAYER